MSKFGLIEPYILIQTIIPVLVLSVGEIDSTAPTSIRHFTKCLMFKDLKLNKRFPSNKTLQGVEFERENLTFFDLLYTLEGQTRIKGGLEAIRQHN